MDILWALEGIRTPFLDTLITMITRLGEEMIIIVLFCFLFWCINKRMAYVIGIVFFFTAIIVQGMKITLRVDRPWVYDPTFTTVTGAEGTATSYAFPSGHTQAAAAYLMPLGLLLKEKSKAIMIALFTLALLVAFSRMYLGVHYLSDVIVSLVIVFVVTLLAIKLYYNAPETKKSVLLFPLLIAAASVILLVIVAVLNNSGVTLASELRDSVIAAGAALGFAVGMYIEQTYINFSVKSENIWLHIAKFALGVAGTLAIMEGGRIMGANLIADGIRYGLITLWITAIYPLIIKKTRFMTVKEK